jgi:hypothetical protein
MKLPKKASKWLSKFSKKELILLIVLLLVGLIIRLYQLEKRVAFGFDQEEIAFKALELLSGDPVVLGQATSVGGFAIGPYFIYFWAFFDLLFGKDPIVGAYLSITLGLLTAVIFYIAGKILFDGKTGLFLSGVYVFSHVAIIFDQSPWMVSMFYSAELLVLLGGFLAVTDALGLVLVALGFAVGFSSHLAIVLSLIPILIFWFFRRPKVEKKRDLIIPGTVAFLGVLPNLLFDVTHNFENFRRLLGLTSKTGVAGGSYEIGKIFYSVYSNAVGFLIPNLSKATQLAFFLVIIAVSFYLYIKNRSKVLELLYLAIFIPLTVFIFWKGNFSEYYVIMTTPPFVLLCGYLFSVYYKKYAVLTVSAFIFLTFINFKMWMMRSRPLNIKAMKDAVSLIVEKGGKSGYGVSLTTEPGYQFGYKYIFHYYGANPDIPPLKGQKKIFTIVIPPGYEGVEARVEYDGIGVLWEGMDE